MRKNIVILLRILIGFAGFLVLLLIERAGIPYKAAEGNSLVVDNNLITYHKESSKDKTCLYIMDSGDDNSVLASKNLKQILTDMRVPYEVYDIAQGIPEPTGYDKVIMGIKHLTAFGEKILDYADYVEDGGKVLFWLPVEREETLDIITGKLGITDIDFNNIEVDYFAPKDDFMLGSNNTPFSLVDYYPSSMQVNLDDLSEVFATCGPTPLIWRKKYGDGYFVVCNFGYCEKAYRGIYSAAYSLLDDVCIYPVINGATFYLDDFPSPVPKGDGTYIRRDYDMDIAEYRRKLKGRRHKLFTNGYKLYVYARADQMIDHRFNDDVAIVFARNKRDALKFFKHYYVLADEETVFEIKNIIPEHVHILTDY